MNGQAFMMTDEGIVPIAQDGTPQVVIRSNPAEMSAGGRALALSAEVQSMAMPALRAPTPPPTVSHSAVTPKNILKQAQARVRELKAEIRILKLRQKELAELERLIAAAKHKPVALVRNIATSR